MSAIQPKNYLLSSEINEITSLPPVLVNVVQQYENSKRVYSKITLTTCEDIRNVILSIVTFCIWYFYHQSKLEKALENGDFTAATVAFRNGANVPGTKFLAELINKKKKQSLEAIEFLIAQLRNSSDCYAGSFIWLPIDQSLKQEIYEIFTKYHGDQGYFAHKILSNHPGPRPFLPSRPRKMNAKQARGWVRGVKHHRAAVERWEAAVR